MSNSSNRELALEIELTFNTIFDSLGFVRMPPVPIIDYSSEALLFTGATINAVKFDIATNRLPNPGYLLGQDCVRLQNLRHLGKASFQPEYMSCFRMFSVCGGNLNREALAIGVRDFLNALRVRWGAVIVLSSHCYQRDLVRGFKIGGLADALRARADPMMWSYGMGDLLIGAGVDILVGGCGSAPRSAGQLVELFNCGEPVGYEFGFGMETLGAAVSGGFGPFECAILGQVVHIRATPFLLQTVDVVTTLDWLCAAGIRVGHDARGSYMRKMLRLLPAIAEHAGLDFAEVEGYLNYLVEDRVQGSAVLVYLADHIRASWRKRADALMLSKEYVENQMRMVISDLQPLERAGVRSRAYLEGLGKLLPIEVDSIVHNMYGSDKSTDFINI